MIRLLAPLAAVAGMIFLISVYLAPDDLRRCGDRPDPSSQLSACHKADAIVAVSGGDTEARTQEAINLYQKGWADTLIFSGAAADTSGPSNAEAMRRYALKRGVPAEAIAIETVSKTTHENAKMLSEIFLQRGVSRAILVTSAYHQRRAGVEFTRTIGSRVKIINHPVARDRHWSSWWWVTPHGWWLALGELGRIIAVHIGASR